MLLAALLYGACTGNRSSTQPNPICAGPPAPRDAWGQILRSSRARTEFKKLHPCPGTGHSRGPCPGWVIDHIVPLACNGPDLPCNMQWKTTEQASLKDKTERIACRPQNK